MHPDAGFDSEQGGGRLEAVDNDARQYALGVLAVMLVQWMPPLNALTESKLGAAGRCGAVVHRNFLEEM